MSDEKQVVYVISPWRLLFAVLAIVFMVWLYAQLMMEVWV